MICLPEHTHGRLRLASHRTTSASGQKRPFCRVSFKNFERGPAIDKKHCVTALDMSGSSFTQVLLITFLSGHFPARVKYEHASSS